MLYYFRKPNRYIDKPSKHAKSRKEQRKQTLVASRDQRRELRPSTVARRDQARESRAGFCPASSVPALSRGAMWLASRDGATASSPVLVREIAARIVRGLCETSKACKHFIATQNKTQNIAFHTKLHCIIDISFE